jgi:hypothetical protein
VKAERTTKTEWFNWTFGAFYVPRRYRHRNRSRIIAGIEIGPVQMLWTEPVQPKQLHPRVRQGRTLVAHPDRG